jgi:outer membrane protein TolC
MPASASDQIIDLEAAWRLAGVANPTIAAAREAIRESQAQQLRARALLLPNLTAGGNYHLHNGTLQAPGGEIRTIHEQSLYFGGGASTLAAQTVAIPAIRIFTHLGDAIYEPLAARQRVAVSQFRATAVRNSVLLDVTTAYLDLMSEETRLEAIRLTESESLQVVRLTAAYAKTGQGRAVDANRAKSEQLLIHTEVQRSEERVAVASNILARLLHLDPATRLHTVGGAIQTIRLVDPNVNLATLLNVAYERRPELAAARAQIAEGETRYRQERMRPLLPLVSVGVSGGSFGGGSGGYGSPANGFVQGIASGSEFGSFKGRSDVDVFAVWSLQNLGIGNLATQGQRRAQVRVAVEGRSVAINSVRREVAEAYGVAESKRIQAEVAIRQLDTADEGFRQDLIRIRGGEGRPIEVLNSLRLLASARQDVIMAIMGYNQSQFQLFVALGQPPFTATLPPPVPPPPGP